VTERGSFPDNSGDGFTLYHSEMQEKGLLWAINAYLLHPRGFAVGKAPGVPDLVIYGDGTEPWAYDPSIEDIINARFAQFEAFLKEVAEHNTKEVTP